MGTRSLTYVFSSNPEPTPVVCMYRQYDGYMAGHGLELAEFLAPFKMVNGLSGDESKVANGMGCLAAQMVSHFKGDKPGDFYLESTELGQNLGQEYEYHVYKDVVTVYTDRGDLVFSGNWAEFLKECQEEAEYLEAMRVAQ
jgi:hypothetical protein